MERKTIINLQQQICKHTFAHLQNTKTRMHARKNEREILMLAYHAKLL